MFSYFHGKIIFRRKKKIPGKFVSKLFFKREQNSRKKNSRRKKCFKIKTSLKRMKKFRRKEKNKKRKHEKFPEKFQNFKYVFIDFLFIQRT